MTVIAYRDGILASDTLCSDDQFGQKYFRDKIRRIGTYWMAESGEDRYIDMFCAWWAGGRQSPIPKIPKTELGMIVVDAQLRVTMWCDAGYGMPIIEPFCATGSGGKNAMGAFRRKATAIQAVRAAIEDDPNCGGRVRYVDIRRSLRDTRGWPRTA